VRPPPNQPPASPPHVAVVLVEDHAEVREQLVAMMRDAGIEVLAAVDGITRGFAAVVEKAPDVVVLDNQLPDGTGTDLCRRLTKEVPGPRVIMHVGAMTATEERAALAAGARAVVRKSVRPDALIHAVLQFAAPAAGPSSDETPIAVVSQAGKTILQAANTEPGP